MCYLTAHLCWNHCSWEVPYPGTYIIFCNMNLPQRSDKLKEFYPFKVEQGIPWWSSGWICASIAGAQFQTLVGKLRSHMPLKKEQYHTPIFLVFKMQIIKFPGGSDGKESVCNIGDPGLQSPGLGRSPGAGNGYSLQYSCLENPKDRGAWQAMAMSLQRVRHNWVTNTPSPVVKTVIPLQGHSFNPWWGTKIPHAIKKKKKVEQYQTPIFFLSLQNADYQVLHEFVCNFLLFVVHAQVHLYCISVDQF